MFKLINSTSLLNEVKTKGHYAASTSLGIWTNTEA